LYICFVIATKQLYKPKTIMYTEAFLFVGNLVRNEVIEKIKFEKDYFHVKFKGDKRYIPYDYSEHDVITLLKDIDESEKRK
jgi:hypothetical protein